MPVYLGYISPMESFLTGNQASYTVNKIFIIHVMHMILGIIILFVSYAFINLYLNRKHSVHVTTAEKNNPSKNMFSLKTLMVVGVITLTLTLIIIYFQIKAQPFPIGSVITSFLLTLINLYFASKPYIVDYFLLLLRQKQTSYEMFFPVVRLPIKINNQVNVIGWSILDKYWLCYILHHHAVRCSTKIKTAVKSWINLSRLYQL